MPFMNSRRLVTITRWISIFAVLALIVTVYRRWLHVNPTTVALTLLLYILVLAARFSLRFAVAVSLVATAVYNFYFLPPVGTFTINDPQNWLALFAFLATSVIGSRLAQHARDEAEDARTRQRELEVLFRLSRELLQTENVGALMNVIPDLIAQVCGANSVVLYLLDGDRMYQGGLDQVSGIEVPHYRQLALTLTEPETAPGGELRLPLRAGVRPRGLLLLNGVSVTAATCQAIAGLVSIALDRGQALEQVAKSEANRESERLRTLILDSITHELRTPLTSIKGAASALLMNEERRSGQEKELLEIIDEETDRLNRLVGEAVEMAQLEAQQVQMHLVPLEIEDLVLQAREACGAVFHSHAVAVELPPLPKVLGDREMLTKVLCNLLENAAKYSEAGSRIVVSAQQRNDAIDVSVADRGVGIDPSEQGLIFDRLYRSRTESESTPGSGMGLSISKAIAEAHRGTLTVTSQRGRGSVFTFSLPKS